MVTASVRNSADGVQDALGDRDVTGIGALAVIGAGGVFLGQEVADQVMPMIGFPVDPSQPTDLAVSALVKTVAAVVLAALATRLGGTGQALAGTAAFGVLVSVGLDALDAVQRGGVPGNALMGGGSTGGSPKRVSSPSPSNSPSGTPRRATAGAASIDNGSFR